MIKWVFSEIPSIEETIFNPVMERFLKIGIDGTIKENIQNTGDAKLSDIDGPAVLEIKTGIINKNYIPGIDEIIERINSLKGYNSYTKETIEHMKREILNEEIKYISFEDSNTKGLKGAKNGQSNSIDDTFGIYAYSKGMHSINEDSDKEDIRGGSYGIGKIANNAASNLNIMFFSNCDEHGNKHIGGNIQLIEHKYKDKCYRSTGYFTDIKNGKFIPYENEFKNIFEKETRGLKIIIPYFREEFDNEDEIIKSVCSNFFVSILKNDLKVIINSKTIDSKNIRDYIKNDNYYVQNISEIKKDFTSLYFDTYTKIKPKVIKINDKYEFKLYFRYDTKIRKGRMAIIRTVGMKIEDRKIQGYATKPFNAILIPNSSKEDKILKLLENESHREISFKHINDKKMRNDAKKIISGIDKELKKIIDNEIKKNNSTDGIMDTKDLLYLFESKFKQDLSKNISTVKVNQSSNSIKESKKIKQLIKKVSGTELNIDELENNFDADEKLLLNNEVIFKGKNSKEKSNSKVYGSSEDLDGIIENGKEDIYTKGNKREEKTKTVRKVKKYLDEEGNLKGNRYRAYTDIVDRVIIGNKEYIRFNFKGIKDIEKSKKCNIEFVVIDGMGMEDIDEFIINESYNSVNDKFTSMKCRLNRNKVMDVSINNGTVSLILDIKERFNKALKFIYYVEV